MSGQDYRERVVTMGQADNLVGILCEPDSEQTGQTPVFVMWNVGLNHRVGPFRFFVDLSRRLAKAGFRSLRFDVSGLGDSEVARSDQRRDSERAEGDVEEAMSYLQEKHGVQTFVLIGFCSGVDAAHRLCGADERVVGAAFLEGYAYESAGFWRHYPKRYLEKNRWVRRARIAAPHLFGEEEGWHKALVQREEVYLRDYPSEKQFGRQVREMASAGKQLLFIYVGGESSYAYRDQLFESVGRGPFERNIDLEYYPDADHTFFLIKHRELALARVISWAKQRHLPNP